MSLAVSLPNADLAAVLQQAVASLAGVIETKPTSDDLVAEMVRLSAQALRASGAGVWVTETPDRPELILEHNLATIQLMVNGAAIAGITAAVRRCVRENKPLIVPAFFIEQDAADMPVNPSPFELLFVPMKMHSKVAMVLMVAITPPPPGDPSIHRTCLNFLVRMVASVEQTLTERHLSLMEKDRGTSTKLVRFTELVHKHIFVGQVAVDIANLARDVMDADRVMVELYPQLRRKVVAVSNVDEPNRRAHVLQAQRLLFDYVRDRHVPVILDRNASKELVSDPVLQDAAAAYFGATEFDAFMIAPVKTDEHTHTIQGVILIEYASSEKAQPHSEMLPELARLCGGSVANAIEVESVPLIRSFLAARSLWRKPTSTKRTMILAAAGAIAIAAAIIGVIPFDFAIKADCQIRPSAQLEIVAPVEQRIIEMPVRAGEHVYPKDGGVKEHVQPKPLAVFDTTELVAAKAEQIGKLGELKVQLKDSQSKGDMSKIGSAQKQIEQVQGQIQLLDQEIDQCTVWSPIEGTVLTENVEQKRWSTPKKSEPLMEVASFSDWELVVDVPESEVATVRAALEKASRASTTDGQPDLGIDVEYVLYPWPDTRYSVQAKGVATLLPASHETKSANVFRLQVKLDPTSLPAGIAMSGVTGRAKIHVGHKPLITQWTRGAIRLLKMTMFF